MPQPSGSCILTGGILGASLGGMCYDIDERHDPVTISYWISHPPARDLEKVKHTQYIVLYLR